MSKFVNIVQKGVVERAPYLRGIQAKIMPRKEVLAASPGETIISKDLKQIHLLRVSEDCLQNRSGL